MKTKLVPIILVWALLLSSEFIIFAPEPGREDGGSVAFLYQPHYTPPIREQGFRKGPYLQNVTITGITISFELYEPSPAVVHYGTTQAMASTAYSNSSATFHQVRLEALQPSTAYYYQVDAGGVMSPLASFRTARYPWESFRVVFYGDSRSDPNTHGTVCAAIAGEQPDLVFNTGDLVYDGNEDQQWDEMHFWPARGLMMNVPMYPSLGNHEHHADQYFKYFQLPGPNGEEKWYSFDYGNIHFIGLSSEDDYQPGSVQYQWLEQDLQQAQNESKWIFAYWHTPPYNTGVSHGTGNPTDGPEGTDQRDTICALLEQYGAQMVFNGHEHIYQHSYVNGVHYVITGGGGAFLSYYGGSHDWDVVCSDRSYHYVLLEFLTPWHVRFTAKRYDGSIIEQFEQAIPQWDGPPAPARSVVARDTPGDNGGSIYLKWEKSQDDGDGWNDVASYEVLRSKQPTGPFTSIATLPPGTTEYYDTTTTDGTPYYYEIRVNDANQSTESQPIGPVYSRDNLMPLPPPSVDAEDVAGDNGGAIEVHWDPSSSPDVKEFRLYRSESADITNASTPLVTLPPGTYSYIDSTVTTDVDYYYGVAVWDGTYLSDVTITSSPARAVWDGAPAPPELKKVLDVPDDDGTALKLVWDPSPDDSTDGDVTEYHIYRADAETMSYDMVGTALAGETEWTDTGLSPENSYYYYIRAFDSVLESKKSDVIGPVSPVDDFMPSPPENIRTGDIGDTWAEIRWESHDTKTSGFNIYLNNSDGDMVLVKELNGVSKTSCILDNLAPGTEYVAAVTAVSSKGRETAIGEDVTVDFSTLNPPFIREITVEPDVVPNDGTDATVTVKVEDADTASDIIMVSGDIKSLGLHIDMSRISGGTSTVAIFQGTINLRAGLSPGEYTVEIQAIDTTSLDDIGYGTLTIVDADSLKNHAPTIKREKPAYATLNVMPGSQVSFEVSVEDPDQGDSLDVKWVVDGTQVASGEEYNHTFTENGTHVVAAIVRDSGGKTASIKWTVNVGSVNDDTEGSGSSGGESTGGGKETTTDLSAYYLAIAVVLTTVAVAVAGYVLHKRGVL